MTQEETKSYLWVTCYCDGSFSDRDGGAWSVWLRSDHGRIIRSGKCPDDTKDAMAAEFYAAYMGVKLAKEIWPANAVQINSDCMAVVNGLDKDNKWNGRKDLKALQVQILGFGLRIRTKHVRAHTGQADTRSYLNRKCDEYAKRARCGVLHEAT